MTHGPGLNKRLCSQDSDDLVAKKRKKAFLDSSGMLISSSDGQHLDKKLLKDLLPMGTSKLRLEGKEAEHRKGSNLLPIQDLVDHNDSDMEDQSKSDVSRTHFSLPCC